MITANAYTVVEFDDEGRERIEAAIKTLREVYNALAKVGGGTSDVEAELEDAVVVLRSVLDGERW